jgi:uncharacterized protein
MPQATNSAANASIDADTTVTATPDRPSLIDYPSDFPIKVMGLQAPGFFEAMVHTARAFDPDLDPSAIEQRPSRGGKYLGLTITVRATSREQLDELYRTLSSHPMVKVVM